MCVCVRVCAWQHKFQAFQFKVLKSALANHKLYISYVVPMLYTLLLQKFLSHPLLLQQFLLVNHISRSIKYRSMYCKMEFDKISIHKI